MGSEPTKSREGAPKQSASGALFYKRPAPRRSRAHAPPGGAQKSLEPAPLPAAQRAVLRRIAGYVQVREVSGQTVSLTMAGVRPPQPSLPPGYYFKGGAARETLRRVLQPATPFMFIRDRDLVRFAGVSDQHDHELAARFMGSDYEHGHGVEVVESREVYFRTRDLTVNEVLHRELEFECTFAALQDLLGGMLRPTRYALDAEGNVQGVTLMKALRLEAEGLLLGMPFAVEGFAAAPRVSAFEIALHLDRALAVSRAAADEYIFSAWRRGLLLPRRQAPPSLLESVAHLAPQLRKGVDFFRHLRDRETNEG
jgi:hypothetical protein